MSIPKSLRESFSPEELKEHVELFESFDTDGSGEIDAEELQQLCATMGNTMTLEESKEMINDIDTDGNGLVDISEFLTMMLDIKNSPETIASAANDKRISFKNVAMKQASLARDKKERLLREKEARAVERVAMTEEKQQGALVRAYDMKKRAQMEKMQQSDIAYFYHQELQEKIEVEKNIKIERKAQMLDHFELHIDDHDDHRDRNIERERETQELKRVFLLLDTNMDGTVSKKEVMKVMMEQQEAYFILRNSKYLSGLAHVRKWAAIFDNIDGDHNGDLSIDELLKYVSERSFELKRNALSTEEGKELRRVFDLIDTDGSNTVTRKEVMKAMMEQGKAYEALRSSEYLREFASVKKWALMFDKMDDGDGAITISELISYVAIRAAHRKPPKPEKSPRSPQNKSVPTLDNMKPIDLAKIEDNIEHTPTISAKPEKLSESRKGSETVMDLTNEMDDHVEIDAKETGDDAKETEDDAKEDVGEPINGSSDSKKRSEAVMVETNSASLDEKESDLDMTEGAADAASNANDNDELGSFELRDVKKEAKER